MSPLSTPGHQSRFSETSPCPSGTPASWLSLPHHCKSSTATPATQYSSQSWRTSDHKLLSRTLTIDPDRQPTEGLQRKYSILSWSLFRSKRYRAESHSRTVETRKEAVAKPCWWPSAPDLTTKKKLKISPPIPLRPESLCRQRSLQSTHQHGSRDLFTDGYLSGPPPVPPSEWDAETRRKQQLADLDPDKRGLAFVRIHPDGWSKVTPKQWVEDQFSNNSSDAGADDDRSVYSQSNGGEICKPLEGASAVENEKGHVASLHPPTDTVEQPAVGALNAEVGIHPRWSAGLEAGLSSSDPIRYWMSSLRPLPDPHLSFPTQYSDEGEHDEDDSSPRKSKCQNKRPHQVFTGPFTSNQEPSASLEPAIRVNACHSFHSNSLPLVPRPLRLSQRHLRAPPPATATKRENEIPHSRSNCGLVCVQDDQDPESKSLQSSWSTIYCGGEGGGDAAAGAAAKKKRQVGNRLFIGPLGRTYREKALPPLAPICSDDDDYNDDNDACSNQDCGYLESLYQDGKVGKREQGENEKEKGTDRLNADIDEILDMYLPVSPATGPRDKNSSGPKTERLGAGTKDKSKNRSMKKAKSAQSMYPPQRPARPSFATDPELRVNNQSNNCGMSLLHGTTTTKCTTMTTAKTMTSPGTPLIMAYPCAYDPEKYPELRHGREEWERRVCLGPGAAAMACVDEDGQIWI
ncbi:uncharacterized protein Z519_03223 [Cladophialophora bantiana CBS 173.52]|uniref:Rrn9 domain-containing protein n=1 Tax=Cladophialophora bantiana (strain ATCC 10958 / CBS 173.52 / CDC B-1940 / NIH 8579) TaxID=1442370 RepID=A0A0D2F1S6_CLAB1|nr:uncharacterized protein Z519_03223 [Cladophialophora bantiana CBS 173.52]KIW96156.1 hypothetical protein Z519_03223 [Cladophialophora bantiana CBS 173.52]